MVSPLPLKGEEDGRNKFPVCAQETAFQKGGTCSDTGDHPTSSLGRDFSGSIHSWCSSTKACWDMQVGINSLVFFSFLFYFTSLYVLFLFAFCCLKTHLLDAPFTLKVKRKVVLKPEKGIIEQERTRLS